jgi:copper chaperone
MQNATLNAPAISCMHCVGAIKRAVGGMEGVSTVDANPTTKDVQVAFDPQKVNLEQIKQVMAEEGYPVAG